MSLRDEFNLDSRLGEGNQFIRYIIKFRYLSRGGSRTATAHKMELFVVIVNGFQPLTIIAKCSILDVAAVLDPPLLSMEDLPQKLLTKNCSISVEFLKNETKEITTGAYLLSIAEIENSVWLIGAGAILKVNNYPKHSDCSAKKVSRKSRKELLKNLTRIKCRARLYKLKIALI